MRWRHQQWQSLRLMTYAQNLNLSVLFCLQDQQKELRQQEEMSSLVWICTSTQATTKAVVIDANQPGNILESFFVCNSHVLCIASVPGQQMNTCAHEVGSFYWCLWAEHLFYIQWNCTSHEELNVFLLVIIFVFVQVLERLTTLLVRR